MPPTRQVKRAHYPVIDLFAGPGGLGEGFSAPEHERVGFDVVLSVEKDTAAHRTLLLRSFFRQLDTDVERRSYYGYLKGDLKAEQLFAACPKASREAQARCLHLQFGPRTTKRGYAPLGGV